MRVSFANAFCIAVALSGAAIALAAGQKAAHSLGHHSAPSSVQQTMLLLVDPAADALWASVGTSETAHGVSVHQPHTALEWAKVAGYAESLVYGAKRLQTPGFPVGANAHSRLADADTVGTRTAVQIRADIDADPARFRAAATKLEEAASNALTAARKHDADGILSAGEALDAACEACHAAYWYPRTRLKHLPSSAEFGRKQHLE